MEPYVQIETPYDFIQETLTTDLKVVFNKPLYSISYVKLFNDKKQYIVTLYAEKFKINLDRNTAIYYHLSYPESIEEHEETTVINLHDIIFDRGTVRLKQENDVMNTKIRRYYIQPYYSAENAKNTNKYSNPYQNPYDNEDSSYAYTGTSNWFDAFKECDKSNNYQKIKECEDQKNIEKQLCQDKEITYVTKIQECERTNEELKKQIISKSNVIKSKDREIQKFKNSQSTQNTPVIVCVSIIIVLLGVCIYFFFFKH